MSSHFHLVFKMPFYAVRVGREPGVYKSWEKCNAQVRGFSKPVFKKFSTYIEAFEFAQLGASSKKTASPQIQESTKITSVNQVAQKFRKSSNCLQIQSGSLFHKGVRKTLYTNPHHKYHTSKATDFPSLASKETNEFPGLAVVYSDGCCYKNGREGARAGIGVFWSPGDSRNVSTRLEGEQTNQRAELMASIVAVKSALKENLPGVEVRTDSMYTINSVSSWIHRWKRNGWRSFNGTEVKNRDLIQRLDDLCQRIPVKWVHVAGHSGNFGNDQADILSKQGAMKDGVLSDTSAFLDKSSLS